MKFRFTLTHGSNTQEIAEPGGVQGHKIVLERHPQFDTLVESVFSDDKFVFIGDDDEDGDGGADFIRTAENGGAVDEKVDIEIELAPDDVTYEPYFTGLLQIEGLSELPANEIEVPVKRDDAWSAFIKRFDTPVDVMSDTDLDGNAVDPAEPVTIRLTSQKIEQKYDAHFGELAESYAQFTNNQYYQLDFSDVILFDEIRERYSIPRLDNPDLPAPNFITEYAGSYVFDIKITASTFTVFDAESVKDPTDMIDFYIQFGNQAPIAFSFSDESFGDGVKTVFTYSDTVDLIKNTSIRIYGQANVTDSKDLVISGGEDTYCKITAATTVPDTEVQGFWIHDIADAIIRRISPDLQGLYSEVLGSTFTKSRQYDSDGCFSNFVCVKGVHVRGYDLATSETDPDERYSSQRKPFFMSMKEWWDGVNPIFNLALGYQPLVDDSPSAQAIHIFQRADVYDDSSTSVNFDHVYDITRNYDPDRIFKKITIGYNKWESEGVSGIDDPQTKHVYATRFSGVGKDISLLSSFIAASLTIEQTRRTSIKKSTDYKYDNDTFIIAVNPDQISPESPEVYLPELDEKFDDVSNLLHSDTRYNIILSPLRNLLRWADYLTGCLQSYLTSAIKFQSGEGNFDMKSDYACASGSQCQAIICDELAESADISMTSYGAVFGYLHLAMLYDIRIPMEWEDYKLIRDNPKKAIGISQTDSGHAKFFIKELSYDVVEGTAFIQAWPKEYFEIQQVEADPEMEC